jgi:hypothetical protein
MTFYSLTTHSLTITDAMFSIVSYKSPIVDKVFPIHSVESMTSIHVTISTIWFMELKKNPISGPRIWH